MTTSFGALCNDFYINQKLALKLDLPSDRETLLHLFDRVRKSLPGMNRLRRYQAELALESPQSEAEYMWLALRRNSIRSGHVNPTSMDKAYELHDLILELSPYHLTLSPLDVDYLELMLGFDLECAANHDEVVHEALFANSPLAGLLHVKGGRISDVQPVLGMTMGEDEQVHCTFDVRTRPEPKRGKGKRYRNAPISILVSLRRYGPVDELDQLRPMMRSLAQTAELLAAEKLIPHLLNPIAKQIASSNA